MELDCFDQFDGKRLFVNLPVYCVFKLVNNNNSMYVFSLKYLLFNLLVT